MANVRLATAELFPPELAEQLERVALRTRVRVMGSGAGTHRALRRGSSLDFADHRAYAAGDDLRLLDHRALARFDTLVVRRFDAEEEQTVRFVLDTSTSMARAGKDVTAARLIAAFSAIALRGRDTVYVHTIDGSASRLFRGAAAMGPLLDHLRTLPSTPTTDFDLAVSSLTAHPGPPGLTVVVSDLLSSSWPASLQRLAHPRRELSVVHVLHPEERRSELEGDLDLIDVETRKRFDVTITAATRPRFIERIEAWRTGLQQSVEGAGHRYWLHEVADDPTSIVLAHTNAGLLAAASPRRP